MWPGGVPPGAGRASIGLDLVCLVDGGGAGGEASAKGISRRRVDSGPPGKVGRADRPPGSVIEMNTQTESGRQQRTVLLPSPRAFCAGVERAIQMVENLVEAAAEPIFVRKQIVHNTHVVRQFEEHGVVFVDELDEVPDGATVVFSAHGVAPGVWEQAAARNLTVIDATCPLVSKVHAQTRRFAARGDTVVLIGHADHEEVVGTLGQVPQSTVLIQNAADARGLQVSDPSRVSYVTQTTLGMDEVGEVIEALRERLPLLQEPPSDDICYATTNRQDAVRAVLDECDLLLVIGSANSSNSLRLVELAARHGVAAHLIDGAGDIDPAWLRNAGTVAVTAGASTPPILVDEVVANVAQAGPITVVERPVTVEDVHFSPPRRTLAP